jgi:hypothetical protein
MCTNAERRGQMWNWGFFKYVQDKVVGNLRSPLPDSTQEEIEVAALIGLQYGILK